MLVLLPDVPPAFPPYTPRTTAVAPELGRAFGGVCVHHGPTADDRLRDATIALVTRLKDDGLPPERVVVALKAAIARYDPAHRFPSLIEASHDTVHMERSIAYQHVFAWFLDTYFGSVE